MATFPRWHGHYTRRRRYIQLGFLLVFAVLPLLDVFRFDLPAGKLHLFGAEVWLDEWTYLWLGLMFAMWAVAALSLLFGRVYCAYACPQMVFSELAHDLDALGKRIFRRAPRERAKKLARAFSLVAVSAMAIVSSVLFMGYFAPLGDVLSRLASFDVGLWVGAVGASLSLVAFLDLTFLREGFCRSACPYGLLQGILEDGKSLHVRFSEETGPCIECKLCARVCPMEIDIRKGAFQIECTRCGTCIDACTQVLAKQQRPSLLSFDLSGFSWRGWDLKRGLVALSTVGFAIGLAIAVAKRETFSVQLAPLSSDAPVSAELAESRFLLRAANRGREPVPVTVRAEGLPQEAEVTGLPVELVAAGTEQRFTLIVRLPETGEGGLKAFTWIVGSPVGEERFDAAVLTRGRRKS